MKIIYLSRKKLNQTSFKKENIKQTSRAFMTCFFLGWANISCFIIVAYLLSIQVTRWSYLMDQATNFGSGTGAISEIYCLDSNNMALKMRLMGGREEEN